MNITTTDADYVAHNCYVTYTIDDDGIHLQCVDCDFDLRLGQNPSVDDVYAAQDDHQEDARHAAED